MFNMVQEFGTAVYRIAEKSAERPAKHVIWSTSFGLWIKVC